MPNTTYAELVDLLTRGKPGSLIDDNTLTLAPGKITSPAIETLFKTVLGKQKLIVDLKASGFPAYSPKIPASVDSNPLKTYLNGPPGAPAPTHNPWHDKSNRSVGIIGIGKNTLFHEMLVVVIFSVKNHGDGLDVVHAYIQAIPGRKDPWNLSRSFPAFYSAGIVSSLQYVQQAPDFPTLIASTYEVRHQDGDPTPESVPIGLSFSGKAKLVTVFEMKGIKSASFSQLFGAGLKDLTQPMTGRVVYKHQVPQMILRLPASSVGRLTEEVSFGFLKMPQLSAALVASASPDSFNPGQHIAHCQAVLQTGIPYGKSGYSPPGDSKKSASREGYIPIQATFTSLKAPVRFEVDVGALFDLKGNDSVLGSLVSVPGKHKEKVSISHQLKGVPMGHTFPPNIGSQELALEALTFSLDPQARKLPNLIRYVEMGMRVGERWVILDSGQAQLAVEDFGIRLTVSQPADSARRSIEVGVSGLVEIGTHGGVVAFVADVFKAKQTDVTISVDLYQGFVTLSDAIGLLIGGGGVHLPYVAMTELAVEVDARKKSFYVYLDLSSSWTLPFSHTTVDVKDLALEMSHKPGDTACKLHGEIELDGWQITATADHPGTNEGWDFSGQVSAPPTSLGELIGDLKKKLGFRELPLPGALDEVALKSVASTFNTKTKDFTFHIEGTFKKSVRAELALQVIHQGDGDPASNTVTTDASGKLTFDDRAGHPKFGFELIFDKTRHPGGGPTDHSARGSIESFVGVYQGEANQVNLSDLLSALDSKLDGPDVEVALKSALFAHTTTKKSTATTSKSILALDVGGDIDLSALGKLPIVGSLLGHSEKLKLLFHILHVTKGQTYTRTELENLNQLLGQQSATFPADKNLAAGLHFAIQLTLGDESPLTINFGAGGRETRRAMPYQADGAPPPTGMQPATDPRAHPPTATTASDGIQWLRIQKAFGPLHVSRLGLKLEKAGIDLFLDASIGAELFSCSLLGLEASIPLKGRHHTPRFSLHGLGIELRKGPLELAGALLVNTDPQPVEVGGQRVTIEAEFDGLATAQFETLSLGAAGSYAKLKGTSAPSLFVFAYVDDPIGGPPYFFVTGLAGGFGFNRFLRRPRITRVASYWLVQLVTGQASSTRLPISGTGGAVDPDRAMDPDRIAATLRGIEKDVPPMVGEYWLAAGLQFTTFEQLSTLIAVIVQFGKRFELDIIGLSTLAIPSAAEEGSVDASDPLVEAQLALDGHVIPADGVAVIAGQLTRKSHILSPDCLLRGGFAFGAWADPGDFVITLGGYAPAFRPPDYYPAVPRLGIDWRLGENLDISGGLYFALTPHVFMAGGYLSAVFEDGGFGPVDQVKASFDFGVDFLLGWKPFHYAADAHIAIELDATISFFGSHHVSFGADADLELWGPEFGGHAHVSAHVIAFHVHFNIDFGAGKPAPPPLVWGPHDHEKHGQEKHGKKKPQKKPGNVQTSFLPTKDKKPHEDAYLSVNVTDGMEGKIRSRSRTYFVVNPKRFAVTVQSVLPTFGLDPGGTWHDGDVHDPRPVPGGKTLGVAPMATATEPDAGSGLSTIHRSRQKLKLTGPGTHKDFKIEQHTRSLPAALWNRYNADIGNADTANGRRLIDDVLVGYRIGPVKPFHPTRHSAELPSREFKFQVEQKPAISTADPGRFAASGRPPAGAKKNRAAWRATQKALRTGSSGRAEMLAALGFDTEILNFNQPMSQDSAYAPRSGKIIVGRTDAR